jgi:hypothetical protein
MNPDVRALMALARAKTVRPQLAKVFNPQVTENAVLAALTAWFGSRDAIKADSLPPDLIDMLVELGIDSKAAIEVGEMATVKTLSGRSSAGSPGIKNNMTVTQRVAADEPHMRALYVLAAARRLSKASDYDSALSLERQYLASHVAAGQNRRRAAKKVDDLGDRILVWRTAGDKDVTSSCAMLEGRLFTAKNLPAIPGAVHPHCRCHAEVWGHGPLIDFGVPS